MGTRAVCAEMHPVSVTHNQTLPNSPENGCWCRAGASRWWVGRLLYGVRLMVDLPADLPYEDRGRGASSKMLGMYGSGAISNHGMCATLFRVRRHHTSCITQFDAERRHYKCDKSVPIDKSFRSGSLASSLWG